MTKSTLLSGSGALLWVFSIILIAVVEGMAVGRAFPDDTNVPAMAWAMVFAITGTVVSAVLLLIVVIVAMVVSAVLEEAIQGVTSIGGSTVLVVALFVVVFVTILIRAIATAWTGAGAMATTLAAVGGLLYARGRKSAKDKKTESDARWQELIYPEPKIPE